MKHLGLFEGIGGFSLAARWMGWKTVAWCEWNEFGQRVLKHHFPEAEGHGDITKTNFTKYANTIDILTGGFPCQPYSGAGKRKGTEDDRHLWPEMLRAIREVKPKWIVGENVYGIISWSGGLVFEQIQLDLESEGYQVQPIVLPAVSKDCDHKRDRVWFIAYSEQITIDATIPKDKQTENFEAKQEEWSEAGYIIELGTAIGDSPTSFHNGICFEPTIIRINDGFPQGLDEIEAYGNAIVPQVAYEIFKAIQKYEDQQTNIV